MKFPPAWKIFAAKIQRKLRILRRPKKTSVYMLGSGIRRRSFLEHSKKHGSTSGAGLLRLRHPRRCAFKKKQKHSPVFVDKLIEPVHDTTVIECGLQAEPVKFQARSSIKVVERSADETSGALIKAGEEEGGNSVAAAADDMWESVAMASSLMDRIDERAEEFIAKFRAEMIYQEEMVSRDL